jgi:hypothetical protein
MRSADELLYSADLSVLYGVLSRMVDVLIEHTDKKEVATFLLELEKFTHIHETRTNDLMLYKEKIDTARNEYTSMRMQRDGYKEKYEALLERYNKMLSNL